MSDPLFMVLEMGQRRRGDRMNRIEDRIEIGPDCWEWTGNRNVAGYGFLTWQNRGGIMAHRFVYETLVESIPAGLEIDHLCRNPGCVNPDHLEPVTHAENMRRGVIWNVQRGKTHCPKGHPYDVANTYRNSGRRHCRACHREVERKRRLRANA